MIENGTGYAYVVTSADNVATVLDAVSENSRVCFTGETSMPDLTVPESVRRGFKIALRDIENGELIIKYGIPIGRAYRSIPKGCCVHIHNMASLADARVKNYNVADATPEDRSYELENANEG